MTTEQEKIINDVSLEVAMNTGGPRATAARIVKLLEKPRPNTPGNRLHKVVRFAGIAGGGAAGALMITGDYAKSAAMYGAACFLLLLVNWAEACDQSYCPERGTAYISVPAHSIVALPRVPTNPRNFLPVHPSMHGYSGYAGGNTTGKGTMGGPNIPGPKGGP